MEISPNKIRQESNEKKTAKKLLKVLLALQFQNHSTISNTSPILPYRGTIKTPNIL
jgi:hypothetical protein